ncbi:hypothetical protein M5C99_04935 [Acidovorax sp. NCPPB 2350]|nr:hypothetical protein M5C99_04935 [Acidovorax sp. NCPPB 2350]
MATEQRNRIVRARKKTEVPGQALGYGLQYTRLTQLLLLAPEGSFCSMEVLDDVAEEHAAKGVRLVQSKSALTANPVSDRAKSLWKTFSNWVDAASAPGFDVQHTVFEIYVSRPVEGAIVQSFADAKTPDAARVALAQAQSALWGEAPEFAFRAEVALEIAPFVQRVFDADPELVTRMICNFQLTLGSGSPQADVETIIRGHPVSPSKVRDIADHLCGVVKRRVDELLEAGLPAVLSRDQFAFSYAAFVRKIDREMVLQSRAKAPSTDETRGYLPKVFVQQLDIIGMPYEDKLGAVSDFLMAAADRTEWAMRGEVDETSFGELDDILTRTWKNKRRSSSITHTSRPEELQGQALYADCMVISSPLQAMQPPAHFIPGCLHRLADDLSIGWHPTYEQKLKVKKAA